ncbi:MAG: hypothetical protein ACD_75C00414G0003 [uncultured bacterium]|nr:MAG: hypothetical protein ACD_75C00414G0003 [uncultured bacterium]
MERQGADAPFAGLGVVVAEMVEPQFPVGIVQGAQLGIEQFRAVRPCRRDTVVAIGGEPFFVGIIKERLLDIVLVQEIFGEKEIGLEPLKKFAEGAGLAGELGSTLAVGVEVGAGGGAKMHRPAARRRILPTYRLGGKIQSFEERGGFFDGFFEGGVLAGNVGLGEHGCSPL